MLSNKVKIRLQGHEKFPLREGWLNKGISAVKADPLVFQGKDGPDVFGIGSNMVKSLRYWLKAFNLIKESSGKGATLTELAEIIEEYDPYFEDVFTIWTLHSQIAKNKEEATSWYMFFNKCNIEELPKDKIESILLREITNYAIGQSFSEKSVKNDLDVLISMYGKDKNAVDPEDNSISPFVQLRLLRNSDGLYSKVSPDNRIVSEWIVLYELAVLMQDKDNISIEQAIQGECGIANIYQLSSVVSNELLDRLEAMDYIRVDRTAGLDIIYRKMEFDPISVIKDYYTKRK